MMLGRSLYHPTATPWGPKPRRPPPGPARNSTTLSGAPTPKAGPSRAWQLVFGFLLQSDKLRKEVLQPDLDILLPCPDDARLVAADTQHSPPVRPPLHG